MSLREEIESAFASRNIPDEVIESEALLHAGSDVEDTLWFAGRDWHEIIWDDWERYNVAVHFLSRDAFLYFLPSILVRSSERPEEWLWPADTLIESLDRTSYVDSWDQHFIDRFLGLSSEEYDVLRKWLLHLSQFSTYHRHGTCGLGDNLGRAFDTVTLL